MALSFELEPGKGEGDLWLTQDKLNGMVSEAACDGYLSGAEPIRRVRMVAPPLRVNSSTAPTFPTTTQ